MNTISNFSKSRKLALAYVDRVSKELNCQDKVEAPHIPPCKLENERRILRIFRDSGTESASIGYLVGIFLSWVIGIILIPQVGFEEVYDEQKPKKI